MTDAAHSNNGWWASAKVYLKPPVLAMLPLGFSSGLPLALTAATLTLWMRREGVDLGSIGLLALVGSPYAMKFLWSPFMDRLPLPPLTTLFGRRRGWLLATQILLIAAIVGLAAAGGLGAEPHLGWVAVTALAVAFFSASQDIVIDAFRIESIETQDLGAGAAMYVYGYRVGLLASGAGALYMADIGGWFTAYVAMAGLVGVGVLTVLLRPEPPFHESPEAMAAASRAERYLAGRPHLSARMGRILAWVYVAVIEPFAEFMGRRGWLLLIGFATLYKFGDSLAGAMTSPLLADLGFTNQEIANVVKVFGLVATLVGLGLGGGMMKRIGLVPGLWVAGILQLVSNGSFAVLANLGHSIPFLAFTIGFENFASGLGMAVFVAYLSTLCNVSFTATQYALLSSLFALARTWLSSPAGFLAEFTGWTEFFLLTMVAAVPGLILLALITRQNWLEARAAAE